MEILLRNGKRLVPYINMVRPGVSTLTSGRRFISASPWMQTFKNVLPILTLYTKEDCTLCDEAIDVLRPHLHKVTFEKVDITEAGNEHLYGKFRYDIPVFHLNGKYLMKHCADVELFLERLKSIRDNIETKRT